MKIRWILGAAAMMAVSFLGFWPFEKQDTGDLYIVETLVAEPEGTGVRLWTGEVSGRGETMAEAVEALEELAPGTLFLRQTERVIFCGGAEDRCRLGEIPEALPMGAYLYCMERRPEDLERLDQVLKARERRRKDTPTLAQAEAAMLSGETPALAPVEQEAADGT